jgi:hypothetical protein
VIPEFLLDEDTEGRIESAAWVDSDLMLGLTLLSDESRWQITCAGVTNWRLEDRFIQGLRLSDDDPVLWESQFAIYTTYFAGKPSNAHRAACAVLSAIPRRSGVFRMLTPTQIADLLNTGNASLGALPVPVIRKCQSILKEHGVEVYDLRSDQSEATKILRALIFGDRSYVIAEQFDAQRRSPC